jgi:transcriptional regulator with XRE-family HTH domain
MGGLISSEPHAGEVIRVTSAKQLANALYSRRLYLGLPLRVVAERTGQHIPAVSLALNGGTEPRISTLLRLANALGYDLVLIPQDSARPGMSEAADGR